MHKDILVSEQKAAEEEHQNVAVELYMRKIKLKTLASIIKVFFREKSQALARLRQPVCTARLTMLSKESRVVEIR